MTDFWYRTSLRLLPGLVAGLIRLWFSTCRLKTHGGEEMLTFIDSGGKGIATFWHYSFLYNFYYLRGNRAAVMVSASRDGEYIARLAEKFGHVPVRGSSNRRGFRALREMLVELKRGNNAAVVADGSQGPARRAQAGCILMASRSGDPIFPLAWAASRCLTFKSWDRTVIPLPFSTVVLYQGKSMRVPPNLDQAAIEAWRLKLEQELNRLYNMAWTALGKEAHDQDLPRSRTSQGLHDLNGRDKQ
ncbi:MAG: lysophospholipid acyltransferase family protein [Desulfobulbaceae bacterium]|nr:lysophospholipid acyltransferase family protein [Desulfobulbaceae bacterium]